MTTNRLRKYAWIRFIRNDHPQLINSDGEALERGKLLAIAVAIAEHGDYGYNCFPGNPVIGREVECNKDTVSKYRAFLVEIGWFVPNGQKTRNLVHLDMSIPDREPIALNRKPRNANTGNLRVKVKRSQATPTPTDDDPWTVDTVPSARPTQTVSEPSRASSDRAATHVGSADPNGVGECPACVPALEKSRVGGNGAPTFGDVMLAHARAVA